jgi:NTE family protein
VKLGNEYYGDGSMRQLSPISSALHLGAKKILIIGLRSESDTPNRKSSRHHPTLGQISGYVLDTLFLNSLHSDIERMERVNDLLKLQNHDELSVVNHLVISPSKDIADIAVRHFKSLPRSFRIALAFLGMNKGNSRRFMSYLMFLDKYCQELIDLGYQDAMHKKDDLCALLELENSQTG